jgi:uncharacterized protein with PIN domain
MNFGPDPRFACDAMLGGLARWLRAAGYEATWRSDINDRDLILQAGREERILLSSDTGIFKFIIVRDGKTPSLFIPHRLNVQDQLAFVLSELGLGIREPLCMACGGWLIVVSKDQVRDRIPPRSFAWLNHFWECSSCGQMFWRGTHWQRIVEMLKKASRITEENPTGH